MSLLRIRIATHQTRVRVCEARRTRGDPLRSEEGAMKGAFGKLSRIRNCPDCGVPIRGTSVTMRTHRRKAHRPHLAANVRAREREA
jgi:hypothetical protein